MASRVQYTDPERDLLRSLWFEGVPVHQIAEKLNSQFNTNRTPGTIYAFAAKNDLPRRNGTREGSEHKAKFARKRSSYLVAKGLVEEVEAEIAARNQTIRTCLRCRTNFPSDGPGNRICDPCKSTKSYQEACSHDYDW